MSKKTTPKKTATPEPVPLQTTNEIQEYAELLQRMLMRQAALVGFIGETARMAGEHHDDANHVTLWGGIEEVAAEMESVISEIHGKARYIGELAAKDEGGEQ